MTDHRILVTGDRNWKNGVMIYHVLYTIVTRPTDPADRFIVTHGAADGADFLAGWAARDLQAFCSVVEDPHPAQWYRVDPRKNRTYFFKGAGPERNNEMLSLQDPPPEVVLAFNNDLAVSRGTRDCVLGAIKRKFPVRIFAEGESRDPYQPATTLIEPQEGKSEDILRLALERLYPLVW